MESAPDELTNDVGAVFKKNQWHGLKIVMMIWLVVNFCWRCDVLKTLVTSQKWCSGFVGSWENALRYVLKTR